MAKRRIGYFLEDAGQERFLKALVVRIAESNRLSADELYHDVRNATGGKGTATSELRQFLRDVVRQRSHPFNALVVAIDANCSKYQHRKNEILGSVEQTDYAGPVVCAIPDPHIERWYIADPEAFRLAIGSSSLPKLPSYKCERGCYKKAMRDACADASILAPFGGAEYGPEIAELIDLYKVGETDSSFRHFVGDLRQALIPD